MKLFDRAVKANEERGLDAYWDTLGTPLQEETNQTVRRRTGPGYADEAGGGHFANQGSGHASDQIAPLDKQFEQSRF